MVHFPQNQFRCISLYFYRPQTKLPVGNVFTPICLFTGVRLHSMHHRFHYQHPGGSASRDGGSASRGACIRGDWADPLPNWESWRNESYWNAFLLWNGNGRLSLKMHCERHFTVTKYILMTFYHSKQHFELSFNEKTGFRVIWNYIYSSQKLNTC